MNLSLRLSAAALTFAPSLSVTSPAFTVIIASLFESNEVVEVTDIFEEITINLFENINSSLSSRVFLKSNLTLINYQQYLQHLF
jgi:hypothetical protein